MANTESSLSIDLSIIIIRPRERRGISIRRSYPEYDDCDISECYRDESCTFSEYLCEFVASIENKVAKVTKEQFAMIDSFCHNIDKYLEESDCLQSGTYGHRLQDYDNLEAMFLENESLLYDFIIKLKWNSQYA